MYYIFDNVVSAAAPYPSFQGPCKYILLFLSVSASCGPGSGFTKSAALQNQLQKMSFRAVEASNRVAETMHWSVGIRSRSLSPTYSRFLRENVRLVWEMCRKVLFSAADTIPHGTSSSVWKGLRSLLWKRSQKAMAFAVSSCLPCTMNTKGWLQHQNYIRNKSVSSNNNHF